MANVPGFTGYEGGLAKLLEDHGIPKNYYLTTAFKLGIYHSGGPRVKPGGVQYQPKIIGEPLMRRAVAGGKHTHTHTNKDLIPTFTVFLFARRKTDCLLCD